MKYIHSNLQLRVTDQTDGIDLSKIKYFFIRIQFIIFHLLLCMVLMAD